MPSSRSHETVKRLGCHASPKRTARRTAASEAPPTQMGGCGRPGSATGRILETSVNETNAPVNEARS